MQKGDSLMKIAYLFNVSERSIVSLNNLPSSQVLPGQIIKLPMQATRKHINPISQDLSLTKNTNSQNYRVDSDQMEIKQELRNFISGFDSQTLENMQK